MRDDETSAQERILVVWPRLVPVINISTKHANEYIINLHFEGNKSFYFLIRRMRTSDYLSHKKEYPIS